MDEAGRPVRRGRVSWWTASGDAVLWWKCDGLWRASAVARFAVGSPHTST